MTSPSLLEVRDLAVLVQRPSGPPLPILHDVGFRIERGETLGIVGESGSGKSLLALALIGLLPENARASGTLRLDGTDLLSLPEAALCRIRGSGIGMVFQEPLTALNPAMTIGRQIGEALAMARGLGRGAARQEALALLDRVRIPEAARRIDSYPHELSGGQRQRVGIAIALAPGPRLLVADEPTTALDVTVQADILDVLAELVAERAMALILISHDLGVVARATRQILVLYAGTRFEEGTTPEVLRRPRNPYTRGLLSAVPRRRRSSEERFVTIPGTVPTFDHLPPGCRFATRCADHIASCDAGEPAWSIAADGRGLRCIRPEEGRA